MVRVADENEGVIRKVLEWGADGVAVLHCVNKKMVQAADGAAKCFPLGRRGGESIVRANGFGYQNFDWNHNMKEDTLVIPIHADRWQRSPAFAGIIAWDDEQCHCAV